MSPCSCCQMLVHGTYYMEPIVLPQFCFAGRLQHTFLDLRLCREWYIHVTLWLTLLILMPLLSFKRDQRAEGIPFFPFKWHKCWPGRIPARPARNHQEGNVQLCSPLVVFHWAKLECEVTAERGYPHHFGITVLKGIDLSLRSVQRNTFSAITHLNIKYFTMYQLFQFLLAPSKDCHFTIIWKQVSLKLELSGLTLLTEVPSSACVMVNGRLMLMSQ